jgi:uncharacterized OB-fold protein
VAEDKSIAIKKVSFDDSRLEILDNGKYRLVGQKCFDCGTVILGRHLGCTKCQSRRFEEVDLGHTGILNNFSTIHVKPNADWKGPVPYVLGEVKVPLGPAITSLVVGLDDFSKLKIGMEMVLDIQKADEDGDGNEINIFVWKPKRGG